MPKVNRASAWALASSLAFLGGDALAQGQAKPPAEASDRPASAPAGGRNAFIAPVVDIRIQDQGLALPKGLEEPPITAPAAGTPEPKPEQTIKTAPPATAK